MLFSAYNKRWQRNTNRWARCMCFYYMLVFCPNTIWFYFANRNVLMSLALFKLWVMWTALRGTPAAAAFPPNQRIYRTYRLPCLPPEVNESSGLAPQQPGIGLRTFLTHNDSGGRSTLFAVDSLGRLRGTYDLPVPNRDWEDLAHDPTGHIYVGDFGNNANQRRDLAIYRLRLTDGPPYVVDTIRFRYPDQTDFPPPRQRANFDCEAFCWAHDSLYLFSKNRGEGPVVMYGLPAAPGTYVATRLDSLPLRGMVTGADISPDGRKLVLLTYGRLYFFQLHDGRVRLDRPLRTKALGRTGQAEAVMFFNQTDVLVSNEAGRLFGVVAQHQRRP